MTFQFITIASEFSNTEEQINSIIGLHINTLQNAGGIRVGKENINNELPLFFFAVTGGVESNILDLHKEFNSGQPVYLIAHSANNSLPASLEVLAKVQQQNVEGEIFYMSSSEDNRTINKIVSTSGKLKVLNKLKSIRLGVIGQPSDWLVASSPAADIVKKQWGPEVVPVQIEEVLEEMKKFNSEEIKIISAELINRSSGIKEPAMEDISEAVKVYAALKSIIKKYKLDSITVRCFDIVLTAKTTGCFALSNLTDEGIISGCEGDIMSVITMLWGSELTGEIPWMANPSRIDEENNILHLAHCTVPRKLTANYILRSHFESGLGVGIQGTIPEGPVTLVRIGGNNMEKLWTAEGEVVKNGTEENLCRTQVEIKLNSGGVVSDLLKNPLGNHIVLFRGSHMNEFKRWGE